MYTPLKQFFALLFLLIASNTIYAQLPNIEVVTAKGKNVISWMNLYTDLYSITIQRSTDSSNGYMTIGKLDKPKKGANSYMDLIPKNGKSFYQLIIAFNPDVEWFSKRKGIFIDSNVLKNSMLVDDSVAGNAAKQKALEANPTLAMEEIKPTFTFTPSTHVYTNTYTGHININVENAVTKKYSLLFFGNDSKEVFRLDRISYDVIVLDKHNFNGKGTFSFSLQESGKEIEKGFVNVL